VGQVPPTLVVQPVKVTVLDPNVRNARKRLRKFSR
jgi:hypothetical protein